MTPVMRAELRGPAFEVAELTPDEQVLLPEGFREWRWEVYEEFVEDQETVSLKPSVETPDTVPQALLEVDASLGESAGSMQSLAVANPDLFLNLADMINGTTTPEEVASATQQQFEELAAAAGVGAF